MLDRKTLTSLTVLSLCGALLLVLLSQGCACRLDSEKTAHLGKGLNVRLIGLDNDPPPAFARLAESYVTREIGQAAITLEHPGGEFPMKDEYGQSLRYIRLEDGRDLGAELLKLGYARVDEGLEHPRAEQYRALQQQAVEQGLGLWGPR